MITPSDTVAYKLSKEQMKECIGNASQLTDFITDRFDLHSRSYLEKFMNVLMGEISERMVIEWLHSQGKYAESAVDKHSEHPDLGHDIWIKNPQNKLCRCSVKSSVSGLKEEMGDILSTFSPAFKPEEIRDINIQVYFWLQLHRAPRISVLSENNAAIIGWLSAGDVSGCGQISYSTENRRKINLLLNQMRPLEELLSYLS